MTILNKLHPKNTQSQKGSVLVYVIGFMLLATMLGVLIYKYTGLAQILSARELQRASAQTAASAGMNAVQNWVAEKPEAAILAFQTMINQKLVATSTSPVVPIQLDIASMNSGLGQSYKVYLTDFIYNVTPMIAITQVVAIGQNGSRHIQNFSFEVSGLSLASTPPISANLKGKIPTDALYMGGGMEDVHNNLTIKGDMTSPSLVATDVNAKVVVEGDFILEGKNLKYDAGHGDNILATDMTINGNALFNAPVLLSGDNKTLWIKGNAEFKRPPAFGDKGPRIVIDGDLLYPYFLYVGGGKKAKFIVKGSLKQSSTGVTPDQNVTSAYTNAVTMVFDDSIIVLGDARFNSSQKFTGTKIDSFARNVNVNGSLNIGGSLNYWYYKGNVSTIDNGTCPSASSNVRAVGSSNNFVCSSTLDKSNWVLNGRDTILREVNDNMSAALYNTLNDKINEVKTEDVNFDFSKISNSQIFTQSGALKVSDLNYAYKIAKVQNKLVGGASGYLAVKMTPYNMFDESGSSELDGKFIFLFDGTGPYNFNPSNKNTWFPNMKNSSTALIWLRNAPTITDFSSKGTCKCFFYAEEGDFRLGFNSAYGDQNIEGAVYIKKPASGSQAYRVSFGESPGTVGSRPSGASDNMVIKYDEDVLLDIFANSGLLMSAETYDNYSYQPIEKTRLIKMADKLSVKLVNSETSTKEVTSSHADLLPYLDIYPLNASIVQGQSYDFSKVMTYTQYNGTATCNPVSFPSSYLDKKTYASAGVYTVPFTLSCGAKSVSRNFILVVNGGASSSASGAKLSSGAGTVATPIFSVASGIYANAFTVTLSTTTSGATLLCSEDKINFTECLSSYVISGEKTMYAKATKEGMNPSSISEVSYMIDPYINTCPIYVSGTSYSSGNCVTYGGDRWKCGANASWCSSTDSQGSPGGNWNAWIKQ